MNRLHIESLVTCLKDHFPGFSDESVRAPLEAYYKDQLCITWTVGDVFSAMNNVGKAVSLESARAVLLAAGRNHDSDIGVTWEVLQTNAGMLGVYCRPVSEEQLDSGCTHYIGLDQRVHIWRGQENAEA